MQHGYSIYYLKVFRTEYFLKHYYLDIVKAVCNKKHRENLNSLVG